MKKTLQSLVFIVLTVVSLSVEAQIYKWIDSDGNPVYGDKPPSDARSKVTPVETVSPPKSTQTDVSWEEKERALRQRMLLKQKEQAKEEQAAAQAQKACDAARASMSALQRIYGRHAFRLDSQGERVYITDEERSATEIKAREAIEKNCR
ncbi:MAG: DUF4124 domain-containing protein [Betaproteobacteria bacterium]